VGKATPTPSAAGQPAVTEAAPAGLTGVALVSSTEVGATEHTLLRTAVGTAGIDAQSQGHARPGEASLPPVAPRSKAPVISVVALVVAAAGGILVAFGRANDSATTVGTRQTAETTKAPAEPPEPPPDRSENGNMPPPQPSALDPALAVQRAMHEQVARESLGRGKTEFALANLDEAETRLKDVAADTPSWAEAKPLLEKIAEIRAKLAQARQLRNHGQCEAALPLYQAVLKMNPKVAEANEGVRFCKASSISPTIE
jgi:hypothetical protein